MSAPARDRWVEEQPWEDATAGALSDDAWIPGARPAVNAANVAGYLEAVPSPAASPHALVRTSFAPGSRAMVEARPRRTPLGRRLEAIRQRIIASGQPLLSWDEIHAEVKRRRGEREP